MSMKKICAVIILAFAIVSCNEKLVNENIIMPEGIIAPRIDTMIVSQSFDTLTIQGTNLSTATNVFIGGSQATVFEATGGMLKALVPSGTGSVNVKAMNGNFASNTVVYSYPYRNPVFKPILADPTVFRDPVSNKFYAYGTEDLWYTDNKNHLVAIVSSTNLVNWNYVADAFTVKPTWRANGGIWAPDIAYVNGKYHLYYSLSIWADPNPGIGLAIADRPEGPFTDLGKLFFTTDIGVPNSIDPFYFEDGGKKYLFWGSYSSVATQGTYGVPLSDDGKSVPDMTRKFKITAGDFEGVSLFKKNGYYYFIGSKGGCCDGAASNYQLRVARASKLEGPYLDKNGNDITTRSSGTIILQSDETFAGPGHNARVMTDKNGDDWVLYHAMEKSNAIINNINQRALMLDKLVWSADGWPIVNDGTPSSEKRAMPVF